MRKITVQTLLLSIFILSALTMMMFYPMPEHGIADDPARIHLYNKMLKFWKEKL